MGKSRDQTLLPTGAVWEYLDPLQFTPIIGIKVLQSFLLDKTMEVFKELKTKHIGLFTFSQSAKHIHLYQKYNFWPRFLTSVMTKTIKSTQPIKEPKDNIRCNRFSDIKRGDRRGS
jgi:hypothetical protein